MKVHRK